MNQLKLEYAVLGAILTDNLTGMSDSADEAFANLSPAHFEDNLNRAAFAFLQEMNDNKQFIDPFTFEAQFKVHRARDPLAIPADYIDRLTAEVATAAHIRHYISIIRRNAFTREIVKEIDRVKDNLTPESIEGIVNLIILRDGLDKKFAVPVSSLVPEYLESLKSGVKLGIPTGYSTFDDNTHAQAGDLIVIGARTNVGKTTFLTNILVNMLKDRVPCLYCPTEMRPIQFLDRISPLISSVEAYKFRSRAFDKADILQFDDPIGTGLTAAPLHLLNVAGPNFSQIKIAVKSCGCKVLFLDYLGRCSMQKENTRMREIERFIVDLKNLCVELGIVCYLAVQLSRATDFNKDTEPRLADLSDSSAIEKEADAVVFLWKDPKNNKTSGGNAKITAVLAKNRHGLYAKWDIDFDTHKMQMSEIGYVPGAALDKGETPAAPEKKYAGENPFKAPASVGTAAPAPDDDPGPLG
jgi:replicative DNA helicase